MRVDDRKARRRTSCSSTSDIGRGSYSRRDRSISLEPTERDPFYELSLEDEEQNQTGMVAMFAAAIREALFEKCCPWKRAMPTERPASRCWLVMISAQRNSFHDQSVTRKARRPVRPRQRQVDLPVDLEGVGTFDGRRLLIVGRDPEEVLANEERAEGAEQERHDQPLVGIEPAYLPHQRVVGDDQYLIGHHEPGEEQEEEASRPGKRKREKAKAAIEARKTCPTTRADGDDDRLA